ncbi:MAG: hypothetical protein LUD39_05535 [Opitutae bacterium]|nr:hypothetical protein [Opitutae bacterium]MCD8299201.1 hypothetical protein [Opitutae bacterium]
MILRKLRILVICALAFAGTLGVAEAQQRRQSSSRSSDSAQRQSDIVVRFMYWAGASGDKSTNFFYKEGRDYKPLLITEMSFAKAYRYHGELPMNIYRKATEAEIAARREQGVKAADLEYIPHATVAIDRKLREAGILIPGDLRTVKPVVLDFSEKVFPLGSTMVMNMAGMPVQGYLAEPPGGQPNAPKDAPKMPPQTFSLQRQGQFWISAPVKAYMTLDMRLAVPFEGAEGGWSMAWASSAVFHATARSVVFVLPSTKPQLEGKPPRVEVRQAGVVQSPPENSDNNAANTDSQKKTRNRRGNNADNNPDNVKPPEENTRPAKRRV